ncbi:MAG: T9SS type A sorting domain-containing protein [Vicingaceae bacterium]|nr:T9SS type A sorting domain-containing protein [Vicingaceae bacterium]
MNKANYNYLLIFCFCMFLFPTAKGQPTIQWEKSLGGSNIETATSIIQTLDGGYMVAGATASNDGDVSINKGGTDCWVVKLNANGTIQWEKTYGGTGNESISTILQTADSSYIVVGITNSTDGDISFNNGNNDFWVIKLNINGSIQWERSYGGSSYEGAENIILSNDGGYLILGTTTSNDGDVTGNNGGSDYWVVKIDSIGNILWEKNYGGSGADAASSIQQTNDGGYIIVGESTSNDGDVTGNNGGRDYWVVKIDSNGTIQWEKNYGGSGFDRGLSIISCLNGAYVVAGRSNSNDFDVTGNNGIDDYWVIKIDNIGNLLWQKSIGGSLVDDFQKIVAVSDGGYVMIGTSASSDGDVSGNYGNWDYWVVKIDSNGTIEWDKNLGGSSADFGYAVNETIDNGFIIAGSSGSNDFDVSSTNGMMDFWVVKLSPIVGMDEVENNSSIIIFPNPTNGIFTINSTQQINTIEVFNTLGQAVYNKKITSNSTTIDLTLFPKGLYLVQLKTNTNIITKKIVYE